MAVETGVVSLVLFASALLILGQTLRRARADDPLSVTALCAGAGLLVGAWFLHPIDDPATMWTYFVLAAIAWSHAGRTNTAVGMLPSAQRPSNPVDRR